MQFDSDIYGDAIHLARSMASTFDNTKYDDYDGCLQSPIAPRSVGSSTKLRMGVYPNPTSGIAQLEFDAEFTGQVSILDFSGRLVRVLSVDKQRQISIDAGSIPGLYVVQAIDQEGSVAVSKLVITK